MSERSSDEILLKLSEMNRDEDRRFEDMNTAFKWLRTELVRIFCCCCYLYVSYSHQRFLLSH